MPQMFGRFKNNLTVHCVCDNCNHYFSKLELSFGRDSGEAFERLKHGLKPLTEVGEVGRARLRDMVVERPGLHDGGRVQLSERDGRLTIKPAPQVGFKRDDAKTVWFEEAELSEHNVEPFRSRCMVIVRASTDEDVARLTVRLAELGFSMQDAQPLGPPRDDEPLDVLMKYVLDETVYRVIAKIAFNYAALVAGDRFVLQSDFDAIRQFVRHGEEPNWQPVVALDRPILADETREWRRDKLHLLTVSWNPATNALLGQVSFFNIFNYRVGLCSQFKGVWMPIRSGHCLSLISQEVTALATISRSSSG